MEPVSKFDDPEPGAVSGVSATQLMGWESEFYAVMPAAFAFAAFLGLPSFFAVVCPGAATLFLDGGMISLPRCLLRPPLPR